MNKSHTLSKDIFKSEYLPKKLIEKLNNEIFSNTVYEYRTKNNFLFCVGLIFHKQIKDFNGINLYVPLGSAYWKKVFGGNYNEKVIRPLLDKGIIESHDFGYRNFNTQSSANYKSKGLVGIRYRINPDLLNIEFDEIQYINKGGVITVEEMIENGGQSYEEVLIPDKNFSIGIDHDKARKWIKENAEKICNDYLNRGFIKSLPDNLNVEYHEFLENGSYNTKHSSVQSIKILSQTIGKEFFFFKNSFYVANVEEFLKNRIAGMIYHYHQEISKIGKLALRDKRSHVTLRLHNYLVNFPSHMLQFITINGKPIVQLDLRTSQVLLFANILNVYLNNGDEFLLQNFKNKKTKSYLKRLFKVLAKHKELLPNSGVGIRDLRSMEQSTSDVIRFIGDIFYKDFYEVLQHELGLSNRGLSKLLVFKLLFKKSNKTDKFVDMLNQRYTIIMSIIAGYKENKTKKNEDDDKASNFSVFLQCIEAEIFIDKILIPMREQNIPCFTRHDSVVVAEGYQEAVEDHIRKVFEDMDFKYNHVVDEKFWDVTDYEYLEDIGYLDWLADENELKTDFSIEERWTDKTSEEMNKEPDEIMEKLRRIGLKGNYFDFVDAEFLEELSELQLLNKYQKNLLYDDIINLREGYKFLSAETNKLLRKMVVGFENH